MFFSSFLSWTISFIAIFVGFGGVGMLTLSAFDFKAEKEIRYVLGVVIGMILFFYFSLVATLLNIRFITFPIFIILGLSFFARKIKVNKSIIKRIFTYRINLKLFLIIFIGTVLQLSRIVSSGLIIGNTINYYSVNARDGLWHTTIAASLLKDFPPKNYTQGSEMLKNYHYYFDFLGSEFQRSLNFNYQDFYFRLMPLLTSVFLGILTYILVKKLTDKQELSSLAVFLMYFCGSFGYILPLFGLGNIYSTESAFHSIQSITNPINQPLMISLVLILAGLILVEYLPINKKLSQVLLALIFGPIIGFKAYGGLMIIGGLGLLAVIKLFFCKNKSYLVVFILTLIISAGLFLPNNSESTGYLRYSPGQFIKTMMSEKERVNYPTWELILQTYTASKNTLGLIKIWIIGIVIFIVGNLGIRTISFLNFLTVNIKFLKTKSVEIILMFMLIVGIIIPLTFIQENHPYDGIQFIYFSLFAGNILSILTINNYWHFLKQWLKKIIILTIVGLAVPTTIFTLWFLFKDYGKNPSLVVDLRELEAFNFLAKYKYDGIILSRNFPNSKLSAYTGKPVFFENIYQAEVCGYDYLSKSEFVETVFCRDTKIIDLNKVLNDKNIKLIYIEKKDRCLKNILNRCSKMKKVFENRTSIIYEI